MSISECQASGYNNKKDESAPKNGSQNLSIAPWWPRRSSIPPFNEMTQVDQRKHFPYSTSVPRIKVIVSDQFGFKFIV